MTKTKIEDREQFEYTVQSVAKMYSIRDRIAAQTIGHPSTRQSEIYSTNSMIRKLEREIAEYLTVHGPLPEDAEDDREEARAEAEKAAEPVAA